MITVTEPQVWVLIGVFAAAIFGMIGIVTSSFNRTLTAAISGVRTEISGVRTEISGLRDIMDARFDAVDAKFDAKFDVLDRDIQALSRQVFGTDPH